MAGDQKRSLEPSWPVGSHQAGQKQSEPLGAGWGQPCTPGETLQTEAGGPGGGPNVLVMGSRRR